MNKEEAMEVAEDLQKLRNIDAEDSAEIVRTYHSTILQKLNECLKVIEEITKLSPATLPLTQTAFIIAERDFLDDRVTQLKDEDLKLCAIRGSTKNVKKLIEKIWDMIPDVFESVCKEKGYIKN